MTLLSLLNWTNQIGLGTVITLVGLVSGLLFIRSMLGSIQSEQIRALERQVDIQKHQLKESEKSTLELRSQLAEERGKTDLSSVTQLLKSDLAWKQAELSSIRQSVEHGRTEHQQIVDALGAIKDAVELLVDWGRASMTKPKGT